MVDVRPETTRFQVDLAHDPRLRASVERLLQPGYGTARVMADTVASDWPGDLAGRLLLSLARYARAGAPTRERATELTEALLDGLVEHGYFGPELGEVVDEQQVACHGWVVAGLLQHYYVTRDQRARTAALRVVDALLLPALERLDSYPRERDTAFRAGGASGTAVQVSGGWAISTDIWCVLLTLNGLVPAALETSRPDLAQAIERLAGELEKLDLVCQQVQLHAALAAARCLADYSAATGIKRYHRIAAEVYEVYLRTARALNYATYNWFDRPDSWTESCATVDSLGLAQTLYRLTGEQRYREDAVRITHNALGFAERRDGSFGLDTIATPTEPVLAPLEYDAFWCCTMRGAIGLLEAREGGIGYDQSSGCLELTDYYPGILVLPAAGGGQWRIGVETTYPDQAKIWLHVDTAPALSDRIEIKLASGPDSRPVELTLREGSGAHVDLGLPCRQEKTHGLTLRFRGPTLCGMVEETAETEPRICRLSEIAGTFGPDEKPRIRLAGWHREESPAN